MTQQPCLLCQRPLEDVNQSEGEPSYQPWGGGEVRFAFAFGSRKFDKAIGVTVYHGVICDECAEKYIPQMRETLHDLDGNIV